MAISLLRQRFFAFMSIFVFLFSGLFVFNVYSSNTNESSAGIKVEKKSFKNFKEQKDNEEAMKLFKVSPCYFIPNRSFNKKGTKIIPENSETVAFIQTMKGRIQFASKGVFIGMVVPDSSITESKGKERGIDDFFHRRLERKKRKKLIVAGLGFKDKLSKNKKMVQPVLEGKTDAKVNFYIGKKENWQINVPTYQKLKYKEVWDGIDVEYLGYMNRLEYRVILKPYANPSDIVMSTGAERLEILKDGGLKAEFNGAYIVFSKPFAYQVIEGKRVEVKVEYEVLNKGDYTFKIGDYDRSKELIIDPASMEYVFRSRLE